jgi:hypothetical protein
MGEEAQQAVNATPAALSFVMVVLGTTIHEFACNSAILPDKTRGWSV